jgi:hypothetical protein
LYPQENKLVTTRKDKYSVTSKQIMIKHDAGGLETGIGLNLLS